jgi:hypothetical protein
MFAAYMGPKTICSNALTPYVTMLLPFSVEPATRRNKHLGSVTVKHPSQPCQVEIKAMAIDSTSRKNLARHQGRATALASRLHLNSSVRELVVTQALSEQTIESQPLIGRAVANEIGIL